MELFLINIKNKLIEEKIRVKVIGDITILPLTLQNVINNIIEVTHNMNRLVVVLALNYDSRTEICDAINKYVKYKIDTNDIREINWNILNKYLYTHDIPDPDLIIRTSGEYRISNFLLLQSANAEYIFLPIMWPDFNKYDLIYCVNIYNQRNRRFGLTPEQCLTIR